MVTDWRSIPIVWKNVRRELGSTELDAVEQILMVAFPQDYRECVSRYYGAWPDRTDFTYIDSERGLVTTCLGRLISPLSGDRYNIMSMLEMLAEQLPPGIIPIGEDGSGNYICFDFRKQGDDPRIVLWHHEKDSETSILPVAESFTEFLAMLKKPED